MMDDMRHEAANDDREQWIDTIMACENCTRPEAEELYEKEVRAGKQEQDMIDAANDFRAVER
jgi:hypothetical protein